MSVDVRAHITGMVWRVEVSEGDAVVAGQTLVILESMKMELPVVAPASGQVTRIAVGSGEAVEEDDLLVTLG